MDNDHVIVEEVRAALERDPRVAHAAEVSVETHEGTVTRRGTVRSRHQRRVTNAIRVVGPGMDGR